MELHNVQNGGFGDKSAGVTFPPHHDWIDRCIRFYRARFHFISIPIGIIVAIIHLKFAIEYLGQCTIQPMINIYMIVHASVALLLILLALTGVLIVRRIYFRSDEENNKIMARRLILIVVIVTLIVLLFSFAWLVAGSVWIFSAKSNGVQGSNPSATTTYCQSDLYSAAFFLIILHYVIHGLILLAIIFRCMCRKRGDIVPPFVVATNRV
jgi:hypothetical protein